MWTGSSKTTKAHPNQPYALAQYRADDNDDRRFQYKYITEQLEHPTAFGRIYIAPMAVKPFPRWISIVRELPFPKSDLIEHDINLPPKVNKP